MTAIERHAVSPGGAAIGKQQASKGASRAAAPGKGEGSHRHHLWC